VRGQKCLTTRGCAAVDGDLNRRLLDFIDCCTAGERCIYVNAKLLKAAEPSENSKRQKTSSFLVKAGTAPGVTPSQLGAQITGTPLAMIFLVMAGFLQTITLSLATVIASHAFMALTAQANPASEL
jgi:hypothetical protein